MDRQYHRRMPDSEESSSASPSDESSNTSRSESPTGSKGIWIVVIAALILSLAALGLAAWPLLHDKSASPAPYTDTEIAEATASICAAVDLALRGVSLQTGQTPPDDPSGAVAAAANARLALAVASDNLVIAADDGKAAPVGLRDAVRRLADAYRTVASHYLAGELIDSPPIKAASDSAGAAVTTIAATCKT